MQVQLYAGFSRVLQRIWEFPKIREYQFGGPNSKDSNVLGKASGISLCPNFVAS